MGKRRLVAVIALLGVAWATLWPAISSAHARLAGEPMPLCHMAGMMVDPADGPQQGDAPAAPGNDAGRTHCPLCIMAFYVAFHPTPQPPPPAYSTVFVTLDTHCAALPFGIEVQLPQGRAPPAERA